MCDQVFGYCWQSSTIGGISNLRDYNHDWTNMTIDGWDIFTLYCIVSNINTIVCSIYYLFIYLKITIITSICIMANCFSIPNQ